MYTCVCVYSVCTCVCVCVMCVVCTCVMCVHVWMCGAVHGVRVLEVGEECNDQHTKTDTALPA